MCWKILINDGMENSGQEALKKFGFEISNQKISQVELNDQLPAFDGIIIRSATKVRKELIDLCPKLKFIGRGGVGLDNVDVEYALSKGIRIINTPAASSKSVAELTMAHLLCITRGLQISNRNLKDAESFNTLKKEASSYTEIAGKTLLLIGFGRIGRELAKMAFGCDMNLIVFDPFIERAEINFDIQGQKMVIPLIMIKELMSGLKQADYISLHSPNIGKPILSAEEFNQMKNGVFIINTSRGENLDEEALLNAIENGIVAGAGLDVFMNEPSINARLIRHPKISISSHIGASTMEAQERIALELVEKIEALYTGWKL
ncbi:MAG: 3-phosphoglycerate dehydrogenase [Bacteroidota bacterium]|nr:3-phosphoglycerate dehydrogenase [Bacteroidota bacterium]